MVGVQRRVGEGEHRRGVLDQPANVPTGHVGEATIVLLIVEQRLAVLPQGLVAVHAGAVVACDRLGHEGGCLACESGGLVDDVLVLHEVIACMLQGVEAVVDLLLACAGDFMVCTFEDEADLLQVGDHVVTQILGVVGRWNREVTALDTVLEADVRSAVFLDVQSGIPRCLDGVDLVEGAAHVVAEAHLVEDEELGLGSERCRVRDAGGLEVCLGLRGDLAGITGVRLVGERVDNREGDVERLVLAERVDEGGLDIRNELHIGFVDGLETFDGGAIEGHALIERVLEEFAGRNREVLLNANQIGEAHGNIFDAFLIDESFGVCLGFEWGHGTAPFTMLLTFHKHRD